MQTEILYPAKNRLEFTKASFECLLKNTDWDLVSSLIIYDDKSIDGTLDYLCARSEDVPVLVNLNLGSFGGPASIMVDCVHMSTSDLLAKIDNDVMVPPNWLNECISRMEANPTLDILGIEPPVSRTPHYQNGPRTPYPEYDATKRRGLDPNYYAECDSIGGIGLMRIEAFRRHQDLVQHSIYGGFTEWQLKHRDLNKGWIYPSLNVFLLDRMPIEPWRSLSVEYIAKGWQREWTKYSIENPFWSWYENV